MIKELVLWTRSAVGGLENLFLGFVHPLGREAERVCRLWMRARSCARQQGQTGLANARGLGRWSTQEVEREFGRCRDALMLRNRGAHL